MLGEIASQFDALEASLVALREIHGGDPVSIAHLNRAQDRVRRGANLTRAALKRASPK